MERPYTDADLERLKVPPHSIEAEQAVLGALMMDNQAWDRISDRLYEGDFYRAEHRLIFRTIQQLAEKNAAFDVLTVASYLENIPDADHSITKAYLATLAHDTPSVTNITAYADIVRERSVIRQLIRVGSDIASAGFQPEGRTSHELIEEAERSVFAIAEQGSKAGEGFAAIADVLVNAMERIDELYHLESSITGTPTGWRAFDDMTSGLQRGDMIIVAGRPSMGKTTLAMNMVEHIAIQSKLPVAVFSMEMPAEQLAMRMLSSLGNIDQSRIRSGKLDDEDWPRLSSAVAILSETKLFIDDSGGLSPAEVRARARRLQREHGQLGLVMVDYLQLMKVPGLSEQRVAEVSEISRSLKLMARELNVPVIVLSQLNRSLEQRPNKRPVMSDLRESGAIEQDADVICFIYRDEVYHSESPDKGIAEIIIGKQRNGPIGTVKLRFNGRCTRFENLTTIDYSAFPESQIVNQDVFIGSDE